MNIKGLLKGALTALAGLVDSDHDGKVEFSDLPGAIANLAAMQVQGAALQAAAGAAFEGLRRLASAGTLTSGGTPITIEELTAKWDTAIDTLHQAGDEARARLARDGATS